MKGILKNAFYLLDLDYEEIDEGIEKIDERNLFTFKFNEEVEILRSINDSKYVSGIAYVILNRNNDSMTVDSSLVELIGE